jgi:hypothetical protein
MNADTRTNEELLDAACTCDEGALAEREQVDNLLNAHPWNHGLNERKHSA